jgi:hypothetical protein
MVIWPRIVGFVLLGYLCAKRSFAYLGVPPLFIGEIALGAFLILKPRVVLGTWTASLLRTTPLSEFGLALLVFMLYGVWQVARGVLNGYTFVYTMKFFVFNYYTIYLFFAIWIALRVPDFLPKLLRVIAWANGIYGLLFLLVLRHVPIHMPGYGTNDVPLFSPPSGQEVALVGLLCFERNLRAVWFVMLLNVVIVLAWQVRSGWLALALGALTWGILTGRPGRVVAIGMAGLAVLGMMELADIRLPGRNFKAEVSLSENLARIVAPVSLEFAKQLSPNAEKHAATAEWRTLWWAEIWRSVNADPMRQAFGHGYGFNLFGLAPDSVRGGQEDWDVRTPHSAFYYALGYTGWVGVILFGLLQFAILRLAWRAYRVSGQPAGVVFWVMGMARACFEGGFEVPYAAIPFYLLVGLSIAPGLQSRSEGDAHPVRVRTLSVPGR